jgi:hypothetical protein
MKVKKILAGGVVILGIIIAVYYFNVFLSITRRGEVTQSYWYCDTFMINKEDGIVHDPHHYGNKPLIPFSDHLCGANELWAAQKHGWKE